MTTVLSVPLTPRRECPTRRTAEPASGFRRQRGGSSPPTAETFCPRSTPPSALWRPRPPRCTARFLSSRSRRRLRTGRLRLSKTRRTYQKRCCRHFQHLQTLIPSGRSAATESGQQREISIKVTGCEDMRVMMGAGESRVRRALKRWRQTHARLPP